MKQKWIKAAGIRAAKAAAEGALAVIGTSLYMGDVNWIMVLSGAAIAAITSMLISIKGIPEVDEGTSLVKMQANGE